MIGYLVILLVVSFTLLCIGFTVSVTIPMTDKTEVVFYKVMGFVSIPILVLTIFLAPLYFYVRKKA